MGGSRTAHHRVFPVCCPLCWVVGDVFPDKVQFLFVADDVFIIVALPHYTTRGVADFVDTFGRHRFEGTDQTAEGFKGGSRTAPTIVG